MALTDSLSSAGQALYGKLASIFGANNIIVTSTTGGQHVAGSQHPGGDAIDFSVKGMSNEDAARAIAGSGISYSQLINEISGPESSGAHLHIGAGTGNENLVYQGGVYRSAGTFGANVTSEIQPGRSNGTWPSLSDWASDPAGSVSHVASSYFIRGSMILVGALILLVALWALLSHYDMVPSAVAIGK